MVVLIIIIVCHWFPGRAWLRSTLNEHTLEKSIHNILGDKQRLRYDILRHNILMLSEHIENVGL
jgi:uncharacterized membrane protein YqiK